MKHILIGTAGHVDHGKTALIRALTGIDTDRLKEEKTRGITIDLGFAYMELPGGGRASIVDVPGHEKFIKNMLAGAGGIDLVLLVIAADDGVMPQTREHLGILQLLRARDGIIVLTKCDLADDDWQSLVREEIRGAVAGTFLADAPLISVSSHTGEGIGALKEQIIKKIGAAAAKDTAAPFRVPVDRVFSAEGFGTVVTGTLIEGTLRQGDSAEVCPSGVFGRVRSLQVHGAGAEAAYAGQRVAVNLSGVRRESVTRGDVLAPPGAFQNARMLDVRLTLLKDSPREIKTGSRLHFYYGTRNVLCKAALMGADTLLPGDSGYAQLRFGQEVTVKRGDSFVLRFYSPTQTVGGGVVLNDAPKKYRRARAAEAIEQLKALEHGGITEHIYRAIADAGIAQLEALQKRFNLDAAALQREIGALARQERVALIGAQAAMDAGFRAALETRLANQLRAYHREHPLQPGMNKEELRSRVLPEQKPAVFDRALELYGHLLRVNGGRAALCDFTIAYTKEQSLIRDGIIAGLKQGGLAPPTPDELLAAYRKTAKTQKAASQVLEALLTEGVIISTEPGIIFCAAAAEEAKALFRGLAARGGGSVTLAAFRDAAQTSRKFALSLLEFFDRTGVTRKVGDSRIPLA